MNLLKCTFAKLKLRWSSIKIDSILPYVSCSCHKFCKQIRLRSIKLSLCVAATIFLQEFFKRKKLNNSITSDECVACLSDVCPLSLLGIELIGKSFSVVILINTSVPVKMWMNNIRYLKKFFAILRYSKNILGAIF